MIRDINIEESGILILILLSSRRRWRRSVPVLGDTGQYDPYTRLSVVVNIANILLYIMVVYYWLHQTVDRDWVFKKARNFPYFVC